MLSCSNTVVTERPVDEQHDVASSTAATGMWSEGNCHRSPSSGPARCAAGEAPRENCGATAEAPGDFAPHGRVLCYLGDKVEVPGSLDKQRLAAKQLCTGLV